jgi:hypothetical protein
MSELRHSVGSTHIAWLAVEHCALQNMRRPDELAVRVRMTRLAPIQTRPNPASRSVSPQPSFVVRCDMPALIETLFVIREFERMLFAARARVPGTSSPMRAPLPACCQSIAE